MKELSTRAAKVDPLLVEEKTMCCSFFSRSRLWDVNVPTKLPKQTRISRIIRRLDRETAACALDASRDDPEMTRAFDLVNRKGNNLEFVDPGNKPQNALDTPRSLPRKQVYVAGVTALFIIIVPKRNALVNDDRAVESFKHIASERSCALMPDKPADPLQGVFFTVCLVGTVVTQFLLRLIITCSVIIIIR